MQLLLFVSFLWTILALVHGEVKNAQIADCQTKQGLYSDISNMCYIYLPKNNDTTFVTQNEACRGISPPSQRYHAANKSSEVKDVIKTSEWCLSDASGNADTNAHIKYEISEETTPYEVHMHDDKHNCVEMDVSHTPTKLKHAHCNHNQAAVCQFAWNECTSNPCQHAGTCTEVVDKFICACVAGYTDLLCSTNIDECASEPCQNGATCNDAINKYTCTCVPGFTDVLCSKNINECASNPCQNGATCVDGVNGYKCTCVPGYTDVHCQTNINECASNPCQNGATCKDEVNKYTCLCAPGYTDRLCCHDIDECASNPCRNLGICTDKVDGYVCTCVTGFTDVLCGTNINECKSNPCQNGATCNDKINSYTCTCKKGYTGVHCETNINECVSNPCQEFGACVDLVGAYACTCKPGYQDYSIGFPNCQEDMDNCDPTGQAGPSPCMNGAKCVDKVHDYFCDCTIGWGGKNCDQVRSYLLLIGGYNGEKAVDTIIELIPEVKRIQVLTGKLTSARYQPLVGMHGNRLIVDGSSMREGIATTAISNGYPPSFREFETAFHAREGGCGGVMANGKFYSCFGRHPQTGAALSHCDVYTVGQENPYTHVTTYTHTTRSTQRTGAANMACVWKNNAMYLFGGDVTIYSETVTRVDLISGVKSTLKNVESMAYAEHQSAAWLGSSIVVCGGNLKLSASGTRSISNGCRKYDVGSNSWYTFPSMAIARERFTLMSYGSDKLLAIGGMSSYMQPLNSIEVYQNGAWSSFMSLPYPIFGQASLNFGKHLTYFTPIPSR